MLQLSALFWLQFEVESKQAKQLIQLIQTVFGENNRKMWPGKVAAEPDSRNW